MLYLFDIKYNIRLENYLMLFLTESEITLVSSPSINVQ